MEFKSLLFAGIAFFICVCLVASGIFLYINFNNEVKQYEDAVSVYEDDKDTPENHYYESYFDEDGKNHTWPAYLNATGNLKDAKESRSFTMILFVMSAIMFLVGLSLVGIHFIMEKRADDKMGASFFMDGGDAGPGPAEENKRD